MTDVLHRVATQAGVTDDQCRAVLEALVEPQPEMLDAGIDASVGCASNAQDAELCVWRAMVTCALEPDCRTWGPGDPSLRP